MKKGTKQTLEAREKSSQAMLARWADPLTRAKYIAKKSDGTKKQWANSETRARLIHGRKGKAKSMETRINMSVARMGPNSKHLVGTQEHYAKPQRRLHYVWPKRVKERDGYACVLCHVPQTTEPMHAHHIKPFAQYPELRDDVENGLTLCQPCHKHVHRTDHAVA